MFGQSVFYFSILRKMTTYFGTLFNDVHITRLDSAGDLEQVIRVPITYSPKDKFLVRVDADPNITKQAAIVLPMMSFEMMGLNYDGTRKLVSVGKHVKKVSDDANKFNRLYNPVPYNFEYNLYIYVKNQEDGNKIVEQIMPFFTPDWTATINLIPEMSVSHDIPVILNGIDYEDLFDGSIPERRLMIWTLNFTIKGYVYGPIIKKPIIKVSNTQFFVVLPSNGNVNNAVGNSDVIGRITVTPGLDANGDSTTNSEISIPWEQIEVDDDFGYIVEVEGQLGIGE